MKGAPYSFASGLLGVAGWLSLATGRREAAVVLFAVATLMGAAALVLAWRGRR